MHQLTAPEFLQKFIERQRIIFVGNAPSLDGEALGEWIDAHDVVVRFNEAPIVGFETQVGRRTDILVTNPYPNNRRPFQLSTNGAVLLISPQTRRPFSPELDSWVGSHPVLFTYTPDIVQVGGIDHKASLTTGTYGIHLLSRLLQPIHVSITGFTMFLEDTSHHYWCAEEPKGVSAHDVSVEAAIFLSICNSIRCTLEVTSDIQWVARRMGCELRADVRLKSLTNPKWAS